jgi:hypothetical protein
MVDIIGPMRHHTRARHHLLTGAILANLAISCATPALQPGVQAAFKCQTTTAECHEKAKASCPLGYRVVAESNHPGGLFADVIPGPVTWFNVVVVCEGPSQPGAR